MNWIKKMAVSVFVVAGALWAFGHFSGNGDSIVKVQDHTLEGWELNLLKFQLQLLRSRNRRYRSIADSIAQPLRPN